MYIKQNYYYNDRESPKLRAGPLNWYYPVYCCIHAISIVVSVLFVLTLAFPFTIISFSLFLIFNFKVSKHPSCYLLTNTCAIFEVSN